MTPSAQVTRLLARGVTVHCPETVHVATSVDVERISPGVVVFPGCRLVGAETSIGPGCMLGEEAPVTIDNCQLSASVMLKGGYFQGATLLSRVSFNFGAHVRPGTLVEEHVSCAHAVGLKQTMLMPFVRLGSLVNFCDCLMGGGSGDEYHSEVGSSYVHFNFTPHRDKATPSLFGDVPRGVMLDQAPIFLGSQGGTVGPARIEYGTVFGAGTICRTDVTEGGRLVLDQRRRAAAERPYDPLLYGNINRALANNLFYIGNIKALREWYLHVRSRFMGDSMFAIACYEGATKRIAEMLSERVERLDDLVDKIKLSLKQAGRQAEGPLPEMPFALQGEFVERWPELRQGMEEDTCPQPGDAERDVLLNELATTTGSSRYLDAVRSLTTSARSAGTTWLRKTVDATTDLVSNWNAYGEES